MPLAVLPITSDTFLASDEPNTAKGSGVVMNCGWTASPASSMRCLVRTNASGLLPSYVLANPAEYIMSAHLRLAVQTAAPSALAAEVRRMTHNLNWEHLLATWSSPHFQEPDAPLWNGFQAGALLATTATNKA
jgi:ribosome biogenesis protein Tsr3